MKKIKGKDLHKLGFKKEVEESGFDAFHYYSYEINGDCLLISDANNERKNKSYTIEIFEMEDIRFTDLKKLKKFIKLLKEAQWIKIN